MCHVIWEQLPNLNVWMLKLQRIKINIVSLFQANTQKEMSFFKDFLHDLGSQNPLTFFGKTGFENLTQVLRILGAHFRFTVYNDF